MGRKPKNTPVDINKAEALKRLREAMQTNINFDIKAHCRSLNNGKGACGKVKDGCECYKYCEILEAKSLSQSVLSCIFHSPYYEPNKSSPTSHIYSIENGEVDLSPDYERKYKEFFGEELYNKYVGSEGASLCKNESVFELQGVSEPLCCMNRKGEIGELYEKVKSNAVTVVCGDGGVGKTTLVEKFLFDYKDELNYIQTLTFGGGEGDTKLSDPELLKNIRLTPYGEKESARNMKDVSPDGYNTEKAKWTKARLLELKAGALFVLDNFSSVGEDIRALEKDYPNCKFIITARKADGINEKRRVNVGAFCDNDACALFEVYLGREKLPLNEKERTIFFEQINSWCCGNAEALYYVAKMLTASMSELSEASELERWYSFKSRLEKDLTGEAPLAEKLASLLRLDDELIGDFLGSDEKRSSRTKLLALLSITEMAQLEVKSILKFLNEDKSYTKEIGVLFEKGLIKIDTVRRNISMHPLIAHALKLNGIERAYTKDIKLYACLITRDASICIKFGVFEWEEINVPRGIESVGAGPFLSARSVSLSEGVNRIEPYTFSFLFYGKQPFLDGMTIEEEIENGVKHFATLPGFNIKLSSTVEEIGEGAFSDSNCTEILLPQGLKRICDGAFSGCYRLKYVELPNSLCALGAFTFYKCFSLEGVILSESLKKIERGSFCNCTELKEIIIPDGVEEIESTAFYGCQSLERVHIGKNTRQIHKKAFSGCVSLSEITVDKENMYFKVVNGRLVKIDGEVIFSPEREKEKQR